jgi:uncharacterized protein
MSLLPGLGLGLLLTTSCLGEDHLPRAEIEIAAQSVKVEVADDPDERALGLMYRDSLGADAGMLFVYSDEAPRSFWMKNTRIPLSIAFISADGHVVRLADMQPLDRSSVPSGKPASYALEMNQGWFTAHGVQVGDAVAHLPARSTAK